MKLESSRKDPNQHDHKHELDRFRALMYALNKRLGFRSCDKCLTYFNLHKAILQHASNGGDLVDANTKLLESENYGVFDQPRILKP